MSKPASRLVNLERDLAENGLAFLRRAFYGTNSAQNDLQPLTFSVVDLAVSIEVLIKARLAREHWSLICEEPDRANEASVKDGSLKSVSHESAMRRLTGIAGVVFTKDRQEQIGNVMKLRNRAVHFTLPGETPLAIKAVIGSGLAVALWLLEEEFISEANEDHSAEVKELVESTIEEVSVLIGGIEELVKERMSKVSLKLRGAEFVTQCPRCGQPALTTEDGEPAHCAFCLWKPLDGNDCALEYLHAVLNISLYESMKDGEEAPLYVCPECGEEAFVRGVQRADLNASDSEASKQYRNDEAWACFACGYIKEQEEIDFCNRCGTPTEVHSDPGVLALCEDCREELFGVD